MYPATVLAYRLIGTFLMVVMFVSWIYSNFFFLPLCNVLGPINYFGQIDRLWNKEEEEHPVHVSMDNELNVVANEDNGDVVNAKGPSHAI